MFFAGIYINDETGPSSIVVFEKVLRSARKLYVVKDVRTYPAGIPLKTIRDEAAAVLVDSRFIRKKKVFSQSGRPPKNVYTPPVLIVGLKKGHDGTVDDFRDHKLPVEQVVLAHDQGWRKEELPILRYGNNYYVNSFDVEKNISFVHKNSRILFDNDVPHSKGFQLKLEELSVGNGHDVNLFHCEGWEMLAALSLPIWHCETIRQVKRY